MEGDAEASAIAEPSARMFGCHPLPDVLRAVQQRDPALLAPIEEPDRLDVHQRHLPEIQGRRRFRTFELGHDIRQTLRSDPANQPCILLA